MERLTAREKGIAYYPHCFREDTCDGMGPDTTCEGCDFITQVCERLAAYEDLELAPEQLREVNNLYREKCEEVAKLKKQIEQMAAGWIDVTERLPERNKCVLIKAESTTIAGGVMIAVGACNNGFWFVQNGLDTLGFPCDGYEVVKWRDLPKE